MRRLRRPVNWRVRRGWKGRIEIAIRFAKLLRIASRGSVPTIPELARELDVSTRTVTRDLQAMEHAGLILPVDGKRRAVSLVQVLQS